MNLKIKFIFIVLFFLTFVFCNFLYLSYHHFKRDRHLLESGIKREGESIIAATREALSIILPSRDYSLVRSYGKDLVRERNNITLLSIFDEDGEVIFAYPKDESEANHDLDPSKIRKLQKQKPIISSQYNNYEFIAPLTYKIMEKEERYGFVKIRLYKGYIEHELKKCMAELFYSFIFIILLSFFVFYFFSNKYIVYPIIQLANTVAEFGQGNLSIRVKTTSDDEVGKLGESFNAMAENLLKITASRNELNKEIEERRKAEEALQESEGKLNAMLSSIGDHMSMMDRDLNIIWANAFARKLFGNDIIGKKCYEAYHKRKEPCTPYPCLTVKAFQDGKFHEHNSQVIGKDGKIVYLHCTANVALRNKEGEPLGVLEIARDVTENKLYEEQLKKAVLKAEESELLKSAFLANMSHEIRTPMNAIIGFTDLMLGDELSEEHRQYLKNVKESGDLLLSIIDDILDLSKIDAGQFKIEQIPCSLKEILNSVGSSCQMIISHKGKNISLRESFPENINRFIIADPTRIQQIMNNLLSNAVKFTENGFIEYGVSLKDKNRLEFYVRDTGIGIPDNKRDEIFKPFQQADESHTRKYGGTGLGLTISKKLVELMGGEITVRSKLGSEHGTTFYFTQPYKPTEIKEKGEMEEIKISKTKIGYTILVAEDDALNQSLAREILERAGYNVVVTNDGKEAISIYKTDASIDLILMDMQMPVIDGYEAVRVIRHIEAKEKKNRRMPIIALTAFTLDGDRKKCIEAGMDEYITKPIKAKEMLVCIKKMVETSVLKYKE
ncbi:MAG: ATP-binding protein [bacterium]